MAPTNPVYAAATLTAGLRADFWETYRITYGDVETRLSDVVNLGVSSDKLTEIYGYFESAPYPRHWPRGQGVPSKAFKSVQFNVTNLDWGRRVPWHVNDRMDDQTQSLFQMARMAGEHWATLPERVFFQILTGTADAELLPAIPLAPDGANLYSATDGGGNPRFGVAGGNTFAGTGVATGAAVRTDFFDAIERFRLFQDTEGQPLWDDSIVDQGYVCFFNVANWRVFAEAFQQERTAELVAAGAGAGVTNIILASGVKVEMRPTQRIVGNNWIVFLKGSKLKSVFQQVRQPLFESNATWDNSDMVRDTGEEYIQWKSREGYGVLLPYQTIQIT